MKADKVIFGNIYTVDRKQPKAVLPMVGYYQFIDKYFTPCYLLSVIAERNKE